MKEGEREVIVYILGLRLDIVAFKLLQLKELRVEIDKHAEVDGVNKAFFYRESVLICLLYMKIYIYIEIIIYRYLFIGIYILIISMLQLLFTQTPLLVAHSEERKVIKSTFEQPHFLLCGSCYWCASSISLRDTVEICPSCTNGKLKSMPINISL